MSINYLFLGLGNKDVCLNDVKDTPFSSLVEKLASKGIVVSSHHFTHNGSPVENELLLTPLEESSQLVVIRAHPRLFGGKGGFGALIRAMGMKTNKNRNKDACRDLSGRRLRHVNAEKKIADLVKKGAEKRNSESEKKARKRRQLLEGPRHFFNDQKYMQQLEATEDNMEDALKQGLQAAGSSNGGTNGMKRKLVEKEEGSSKKTKLWMDPDDTESEDEVGEKETGVIVTSETPDIGIPLLPPVCHTQVDSTSNRGEEAEEDSTSDEGRAKDGEVDSTSEKGCIKNIPNEENVVSSSDNAELTVTPTNEDTVEKSSDITSTTAGNVVQDTPAITVSCEDVDLNDYCSIEELERLGPEVLKQILQIKGLKCGGTLQERAQRLYSIKGKQLNEIDSSLFVKSNGRSRGKGKGKKKDQTPLI